MNAEIDLSGVSVLVIDDSRYARSFLKSALQSFGLRNIVETGDGPSGIAMLKEGKIDVVIVDHDMIPMDGVEFTRLVRGGGIVPCVDIPIIMVSGFAEMEKVLEARNSGVNEFLVKPVSAESLLRRLRNVLINPRPFVQAPSYIGPCRRAVVRPAPEGGERRRNPPLPKPPPLIDVPAALRSAASRQPVCAAAPVPGVTRPMQERTGKKRFKSGTVIFQEGDRGDEAYVVETGRVTIFKTHEGGRKVTLVELGANGIFGEMALIDDEPRMASAVAAEDTVCLVIPKPSLKSQIQRTPQLVILVLETLLHDIRRMGRELVSVRAALVRHKGR